MKAILQRVQRQREFNLVLARLAGWKIQTVKGGISPELLEELQSLNVEFRGAVAHMQAELRRRRGLRTQRITRRFGSSPCVHQARGEHAKAIKALEAAVQRLEGILFQIGDACAWAALRGQLRILRPLYDHGKRNTLPRGEGLFGPTKVAGDAHRTGAFLVVVNDLTRCLCTGDLTVVGYNKPWHHPLVFEVKTTKADASGKGVIALHGVRGGLPADLELMRDFDEKLGFAPEQLTPLDTRGERQVSEIARQSELMYQITASAIKPLGPGTKTLWDDLSNVLQRASVTGSSYDLLEGGVYVVAVRNQLGDDFEVLSREILQRLDEDVFSRDRNIQWRTATSEDLLEHQPAAALIPPILLWKIGPESAAKLIAGDLFMAGYVRDDVWSNAFALRHIQFQQIPDKGWVMRSGAAEITFSRVEVQKLRAGVVFTGISPQAVADAVAADLAKQNKALEEPT